MTDQYGEIQRHLDRAFASACEKRQRRSLHAAMELLQELEHHKPGQSRTSFLLGYAWYLWPDSTVARLENVRQNLRDALRRDPENAAALLYLGHIEFDEGHYEAAQRYFKNFESVASLCQVASWQLLKTAELRLSCMLYLRPADVRDADIDVLTAMTKSVEPQDRPAPTELEHCIKELGDSGKLTLLSTGMQEKLRQLVTLHLV